jgi:hypothetical protein
MGGTISKLRREKGERELWLLRDQSELANVHKEYQAAKEELSRLKLVEVYHINILSVIRHPRSN